jgi:hypothetical protein
VTPSEAAELLSFAATFDRRTIGLTDALAWSEVLHDITLPNAKAAVLAHYSDKTSWVMPADIRQGVKRVRQAALASQPDPLPSCDPDNTIGWRRELLALRRGIADNAGSDLVRPDFQIEGRLGRRNETDEGRRRAREVCKAEADRVLDEIKRRNAELKEEAAPQASEEMTG